MATGKITIDKYEAFVVEFNDGINVNEVVATVGPMSVWDKYNSGNIGIDYELVVSKLKIEKKRWDEYRVYGDTVIKLTNPTEKILRLLDKDREQIDHCMRFFDKDGNELEEEKHWHYCMDYGLLIEVE